MSCSCDYEAPEFYARHERTARKEHRCCECGKTITPGDAYTVAAGKWEGYFDTFKTCERCSGLQDAMRDMGYCMQHGGLAEDYSHYLEGIGSDRNAYDILRGGIRNE
jgi:hypothetical protein